MATPHTTTSQARVSTRAESITIPVKGTDSIASLALAMGALPDGHAYKFKLQFEIAGEEISAQKSAVVSTADRESALSALSEAEKRAVEKFHALCKANAQARVAGETTTRATWRGIAKS